MFGSSGTFFPVAISWRQMWYTLSPKVVASSPSSRFESDWSTTYLPSPLSAGRADSRFAVVQPSSSVGDVSRISVPRVNDASAAPRSRVYSVAGVPAGDFVTE